MKSQKSINLPVEFFSYTILLLWRLNEFFELDHETLRLVNSLSLLIDDKLIAMNRREAFSNYITAPPNSPEREAFRQKYLDMTNVHPVWRSTAETLDDPTF